MHGHWTVTVTNPDGTVDAVMSFENAYTPWGLLTSLLVKGNGIDKQYVSFYYFPSFRGYASLS